MKTQNGHIELIFGPMFSGKTSELMRKVKRFQHAGKKCLVLNYKHDNRYDDSDCIINHDKYYLNYRTKILARKVFKIDDVKDF
jgi:thymidine kinase